jgi:hypothetical protein
MRVQIFYSHIGIPLFLIELQVTLEKVVQRTHFSYSETIVISLDKVFEV